MGVRTRSSSTGRLALGLIAIVVTLCLSVVAQAKSKVFVTNNTPKPLHLKVTSNLSSKFWNRRHLVIPPFARKVAFETNRDEGVEIGKTYDFSGVVQVRDSKDKNLVHTQGPHNFQIRLRLKGSDINSHMWQSHRSQDGTQAKWVDSRKVQNTEMTVDGKRWSVKYWAYATATEDDVEYVFREEYPLPTGSGQTLPNIWKAHHLNVLTYNIYLRAAPFVNGQSKRLEMIPRQLRGYDVIVFNEVFDDALRDKLVKAMKAVGYNHVSKPLGEDSVVPVPVDGTPLPVTLQDGGVIIFSVHPIVEQAQMYYSKCTSFDCMAQKGAVWVKINKRVGGKDNFFNIFGTHLDATSPSVRFIQLDELKRFIDSRKSIRSTEPVLIAGDLNINMWKNWASKGFETSDHFAGMLKALDAGYFSGSQVRGHLAKDLTHDGKVNDLASGSQSYLDYVLFSKKHRQPTQATFVETRVHRAFDEWKDLPGENARWDLSDHYAVYASYHFEEEGLGFDPGPMDPPGMTPLYMCNTDGDCPKDRFCDKSQGVVEGAVLPPDKRVSIAPKPAKRRLVATKKAPAKRNSPNTASAAKPVERRPKLWTGVCRIPPPK